MLDHGQGLLGRARADVHELLVQRRRLAQLVLGDDVGRLAPDDGVDGSLRAVDHEVAPREQLRVHAAHLVEEDEALLVDVRDDEPDLVVVARDHDVRGAFGRHLGPQVAQGVRLCRGVPSSRRRKISCAGASNPVGAGAPHSARRKSMSVLMPLVPAAPLVPISPP